MNEIVLGGFLWAPSIEYWDDILKIIDERYELINTKKYRFSSFEDLERVIIKLYENDRSAPLDKIKKVKIKSLKKHPSVCLNFYFKIPLDTNYKENVINMKKEIRNKYKSHIENYRRDIIIYISDNEKQTSFIDNLIDNYIKKKV